MSAPSSSASEGTELLNLGKQVEQADKVNANESLKVEMNDLGKPTSAIINMSVDGQSIDLSKFISADESNAYSSAKSASHGIISISNMALYIGIVANADGHNWGIVAVAIAALVISCGSVILSGLLYAIPPTVGEPNQPASIGDKAQKLNNLIAAISPLILLLNIAISVLEGKESLSSGISQAVSEI